MLSGTIGYVTSPGFDDNEKYPDNYYGAYNLSVAHNESVLINVVKLEIEHKLHYCYDRLTLNRISRKGAETIHRFCPTQREIRAHVYLYSLQISFQSDKMRRESGFKLMFAFLPRFQEPSRLANSLFNCSVASFHRFSPVFNCNLLQECDGGEDERGCAYRNNDCGMEDAVDTGTTCYSLVFDQRRMSWLDAHKYCFQRGQKLAILENPEERRHVIARVPFVVELDGYFLGAQLKERLLAVSLSALYKNIWQWVDGTTVFSAEFHTRYIRAGYCAIYDPWLFELRSVSCYKKKDVSAFLCEFQKHNQNRGNVTPDDQGFHVLVNSTAVFWRVNVTQCPSDHVTRDFLACDFEADCDASYSVTSCSAGDVTVPVFICQQSRATVHYTLVCDHMQHCSDNSDEDFCVYLECPSRSVKCHNGQCIPWYLLCDGELDCHDGSDEMCRYKIQSIATTSPPGSVYLDGKGNFWTERMNVSDKCPSTHFLCPRSFCLPVYLRCNGVDDCLSREDEVGCDTYKCRDFYRCRGSRVCLHADNVCDGVPQCPEQDDEMLCDLVCPDDCGCQGLAFVCTSNFSAISYVSLRYLDVSGSNLTLIDVRNNIHLIALRLSMCHIDKLTLDMTFPNMRELDLSWNKLYRVHMKHFQSLKNLRVLKLTGNPLIKMVNSKISGPIKMMLERVDLSHTNVEMLSGMDFAQTPNVKVLNISWTKLKSIAGDSFQFTPRLENLDMRGYHLKNIPKSLLRDLRYLKHVTAENYKMCCRAMLPGHFDLRSCHATHDLLASCDDLLKSNTFRIFLWVFAVLSLVGNVFSVGARLHRQQEGSFSVFVTNLSVADLFMGVYLAIIGTADFVYRGCYLWHDSAWKASVACNMAGFLCLLSSETSALIICLITLDRFLVLRFPFSKLHFRRRSALVASGAVWTAGFSLASIPLLPMTSHWEFYSQTGICIPLPFTDNDRFLGYGYSFGVSILLNLVLFLFIAVGQAVVYWVVHANTVPSSANTQTRDAAIARRLITIVVSDFLCWFPIGLLGLLSFTGTPIPGDLNVAVATFVLPVNSALNPFLYTLNLLLEKRRKAQSEQLLKRLELERRGQAAVTKYKSHQVSETVDKTVVLQQIKTWIGERLLTSEDLLSFTSPVSDLKLT